MVSKATRLKGNKAIIINAGGVERAQEMRSVTITNDDASGDPTFIEAAAGAGRDWALNGTYKQDGAADSFGRWCFVNEGLEVQVRYAPSGNTTPTPDAVHYVFTAVVGAPGTIGGDADYDGSEFEAEFVWKITSGKPVIDDGTSTKPAIASAAPAGASVGQVIALGGTRFTGASAVKFGTTTAQFNVINDGTISVAIPTGVNGAKQVTVTTANGTSDNFAYTAAS